MIPRKSWTAADRDATSASDLAAIADVAEASTRDCRQPPTALHGSPAAPAAPSAAPATLVRESALSSAASTEARDTAKAPECMTAPRPPFTRRRLRSGRGRLPGRCGSSNGGPACAAAAWASVPLAVAGPQSRAACASLRVFALLEALSCSGPAGSAGGPAASALQRSSAGVAVEDVPPVALLLGEGGAVLDSRPRWRAATRSGCAAPPCLSKATSQISEKRSARTTTPLSPAPKSWKWRPGKTRTLAPASGTRAMAAKACWGREGGGRLEA
mmetsp:Transcript_21268/g.50040  ORF Transcript_21268/g.50040 Transcript_21268/m.50040 type:complete len:272 (+) Transcript_21268:550-1365(+)